MGKIKNGLFIFCLLLNYLIYSQSNDTICKYKKACSETNEIKKYDKRNMNINSNNFLKPSQIYLYFNLTNSEPVSILLNNNKIKEKFIDVFPSNTGDTPNYSLAIDLLEKNNKLTIYFEKEKKFIEIIIEKKYKVYKIFYYNECYYITKKNFITVQ